MISDAKPYPEYKDSGVSWIGEVPEHWEVRRLKYVLREKDSRSTDGREQLLRVSQYTGVTQRIRDDGLDQPDTRAESLVGYKQVQPDELVVNIMLAWNGSLGVSTYAGITSPAYCVYRFQPNFNPWFFHFLLRSPTYKARIKTMSTGVVDSRLRLYTDDLYRLEALVPPTSEQDAIVRFLNALDGQIRRYILAKQQIIKLVEEQKQAIVHTAVTRGLNSALPMKDSDIDSIGKIPQHWTVAQLRRLIKRGTIITYGIVQAGPDIDGGVPYIRTSDMRGHSFPKDGYLRTSMEIDRSYSRSKVEHNDLVVAIRASLGKGMLVPEFLAGANLTQGTARVSPGESVLPEYLSATFNAKCCQDQVWSAAKGATFFEITLAALRKIVLPVPPLREQEAIVDFISSSTSSLDSVTRHAYREIELLREYRVRLIADVIAGKLDVREAAARLPDESEELAAPNDAATLGGEEAHDALEVVEVEAGV